VHWEQRVEYAALSDIGFRRRNNQDAYAIQTCKVRDEWDDRGHLFLVADGMGGHAVGELASKIAADTVPHTFLKQRDATIPEALRAAITAAHINIHSRGEQNRDFSRMGTTCTALVLSRYGAVIGHVGDSRCYRIRGQKIEQLTFDHSLQWELLRQGKLPAEQILRQQPRNVITRSLGPQPTVEVDIEGPYAVRPGDVYLLCSDGLCGQVADEEIAQIASTLPPPDACRFLVDLANLRGGPDNITVVVVRVGEIPAGLPAIPYDPPRRDLRPGWGWVLAFAALSILYIGGTAMTALDYVAQGLTLQVLSLLGIGGLLLSWLHDRDRRMRQVGLPDVTPGTPYRVASADVTESFVQTCRAIEYHLQRTALEEDWSIDWGPYQSLADAAHTAHGAGQLRVALAEYGKAIHILAKGITQLRKQKDLAERWGVKSAGAATPLPPTKSKPEPPKPESAKPDQPKPDVPVDPDGRAAGNPPPAAK
jgi:PPM family protein phosphatase